MSWYIENGCFEFWHRGTMVAKFVSAEKMADHLAIILEENYRLRSQAVQAESREWDPIEKGA